MCINPAFLRLQLSTNLKVISSVSSDSAEEDFRCEVLRRSAKRLAYSSIPDQLGQAHVGDLHHGIGIVLRAEQDVLCKKIKTILVYFQYVFNTIHIKLWQMGVPTLHSSTRRVAQGRVLSRVVVK